MPWSPAFRNIALGYSVVNGTDVYPGIRYTGRKRGDPLGQMNLGEGIIINGSGVQTTTNSRWGDYTPATAAAPTGDNCALADTHRQLQAAGLPLGSKQTWQVFENLSGLVRPACRTILDAGLSL
jgi:hypothetical protein